MERWEKKVILKQLINLFDSFSNASLGYKMDLADDFTIGTEQRRDFEHLI
jgi:hypothetical protein